jgi:ribonuclease P protein component
MTRLTLNRDQRLKRRKQIGKVFSEGKPVQSFPLRAVVLFHNEEGPVLQAGFSVSTRNFKRAVDRNRIKRLMKEVYRQERPLLEEALKVSGSRLSVFWIFTGKELPELQLLKDKMNLLVNRLTDQINGHPQKNS